MTWKGCTGTAGKRQRERRRHNQRSPRRGPRHSPAPSVHTITRLSAAAWLPELSEQAPWDARRKTPSAEEASTVQALEM